MNLKIISQRTQRSSLMFKLLLRSNFLISVFFPTQKGFILFKNMIKTIYGNVMFLKQKNFVKQYTKIFFPRNTLKFSNFMISGGMYLVTCNTFEEFLFIMKFFLKDKFFKKNIDIYNTILDVNDYINIMHGFLTSVKLFNNTFPFNSSFLSFFYSINNNFLKSHYFYNLIFFKITNVILLSIMLILIKISLLILKIFFLLLNHSFFLLGNLCRPEIN